MDRLSVIAAVDRRRFEAAHPEYERRLLAVALSQGAAQHFVDGKNGVKDLDVYSFYAAIPDRRFPAARRLVRRDFGPSALGRQAYDLTAAATSRERVLFERLARFEGRPVDLMLRALREPLDADPADALRRCSARGSAADRAPRGGWRRRPWCS
ncbi:MAG: hypothetical protein M3P83_07305 [Actinomycetota bacterium]|nr:hypothetical protein [Actinomycetota bacterium]